MFLSTISCILCWGKSYPVNKFHCRTMEAVKGLELGLGVVKDIIYEQSEGPRDTAALPAFVVVYFPEADVPENHKFHPALHKICVLELRAKERVTMDLCNHQEQLLRASVMVKLPNLINMKDYGFND